MSELELTPELKRFLKIMAEGLIVLSGPDNPLNTTYGLELFDAALVVGVLTDEDLIEAGVPRKVIEMYRQGEG